MNPTKITILASLLFAAASTIAVAGEPYVHQFGKTAFDGSQFDPGKSRIAVRNQPDQPIRQDLVYFGAKTEQGLNAPSFPFGAMSGAIFGESIWPGFNAVPYRHPYYGGWYNGFPFWPPIIESSSK